MNTQKAVTTLAQNKTDEIITVRRCSFPSGNAKMIYNKLGYKYVPFKNKKSVVHKTVFQKNHPAEFVDIIRLELQCGLRLLLIKNSFVQLLLLCGEKVNLQWQ
jgi:hypothetical protein